MATTYSSSNPYSSDIFKTAMQNVAANQGGAGGMSALPELQQSYDFAMQQAQANAAGAAPGQNPYLTQLGDQMSSQMTDQFNRSMAGLNSSVMAAGGYGGSRQGVLQANAQNDLQSQIGGALANLYNQGYQADQQYDLGLKNIGLGYGNLAQGYTNAALQNDQAAQQNALGWGNVAGGIRNTETSAAAQRAAAATAASASMHNARLAHELGLANLDRNIYNDNMGWQLQGANFGLGLYDRMTANNAGIAGVGTTIQNQPLDYWGTFNESANALGHGFSSGQAAQTGNPFMGAIGGAQMGQQLGSWWGSGNSGYNTMPGDAYMPAYQQTGGGLAGLEGYAV